MGPLGLILMQFMALLYNLVCQKMLVAQDTVRVEQWVYSEVSNKHGVILILFEKSFPTVHTYYYFEQF